MTDGTAFIKLTEVFRDSTERTRILNTQHITYLADVTVPNAYKDSRPTASTHIRVDNSNNGADIYVKEHVEEIWKLLPRTAYALGM